MKKAYFLIPLVLLALFGGLYWQFLSGYEKRQDDRAAVLRHDKETKLLDDARNREKAVHDAQKAMEERKAAKAAKDAQKAKDDADREIALQARQKARADAEKLEAQVKRYQKDIDETNVEITKLEDEKRRSLAQEAFLKDYVKKAEANRASLQAVLEKIAAADKAAEEAAHLAALAVKK